MRGWSGQCSVFGLASRGRESAAVGAERAVCGLPPCFDRADIMIMRLLCIQFVSREAAKKGLKGQRSVGGFRVGTSIVALSTSPKGSFWGVVFFVFCTRTQSVVAGGNRTRFYLEPAGVRWSMVIRGAVGCRQLGSREAAKGNARRWQRCCSVARVFRPEHCAAKISLF